ncbi:MAG TPA: hypothetical protein VD997_12900 [Phycisphaerales bacterium]|nr:hypothetical protein [Phycisphaerales bacterium]
MTSFKPHAGASQSHPPAQPHASGAHPRTHAPAATAAHTTGHTPENCESCVREYLAVLTQQRALLGELDALSQRQSLLIDEPVLEPLLMVLEERQQVIDRITQTARLVEQLRPQWDRTRDHVPEAHLRQVERELEAVSSLAEQVQKRDERDHARLKQRLEGVTSELAGLATSKKAANAYTPQQTVLPRFQDRKG